MQKQVTKEHLSQLETQACAKRESISHSEALVGEPPSMKCLGFQDDF